MSETPKLIGEPSMSVLRQMIEDGFERAGVTWEYCAREFLKERDAARAEVERLKGLLRIEERLRLGQLAERDRLLAEARTALTAALYGLSHANPAIHSAIVSEFEPLLAKLKAVSP